MDSPLRLTVQKHETAQVLNISELTLSADVNLRLTAFGSRSHFHYCIFENIAPRTVISIGIAPSLGAIYNLNRKTPYTLKILSIMRNLQLTQTRKYDMIPVKKVQIQRRIY